MHDRPVILVCGLGRCGTSLTMQMLHRGGIPTLGSWPDFEVDEAMTLDRPHGREWLRRQGGHAVKILDPHRWTPPENLDALVIWLDRNRTQQAASQAKLLAHAGFALGRQQRRGLANTLVRDRRHARLALETEARGRPRATIRFEDLIQAPQAAAALMARLLAPHFVLDIEAAASAVRHRSTDCLPHMLEAELLEAARG